MSLIENRTIKPRICGFDWFWGFLKVSLKKTGLHFNELNWKSNN